MIVKDIRTNKDIKKIVLHHSRHDDARAGNTINDGYISSGYFGLPYDILINRDGTVDLPTRWIFGSNASQYLKNVSIPSITNYDKHYLGGMGETYELNKNAIHIVLSGNFDITKPSAMQFGSLIKVLNQLFWFYQLDPRIDFYYHSDVARTSCPGTFILPKLQIVPLITVKVEPNFIIQKFSVDTVVDPLILNFVGSSVLLSFENDTVTINYTF